MAKYVILLLVLMVLPPAVFMAPISREDALKDYVPWWLRPDLDYDPCNPQCCAGSGCRTIKQCTDPFDLCIFGRCTASTERPAYGICGSMTFEPAGTNPYSKPRY